MHFAPQEQNRGVAGALPGDQPAPGRLNLNFRIPSSQIKRTDTLWVSVLFMGWKEIRKPGPGEAGVKNMPVACFSGRGRIHVPLTAVRRTIGSGTSVGTSPPRENGLRTQFLPKIFQFLLSFSAIPCIINSETKLIYRRNPS